jgi:hypothetical protein
MSSRTAVLHQIDHIQRLRSRPVNLVDGTIVRVPPDWFQMVATQSLNNSSVDEIVMKAMEASTGDVALAKLDHFCDGENIDALEHFFWGQTNGIAMEIGALDGSQETRSMTFDLEQSFGWRRILVEGNPMYKYEFLYVVIILLEITIMLASFRRGLRIKSPEAFTFNSAVCQNVSAVHYCTAEYIGGIVEFMAPAFLRRFHESKYNATNPPGNVSSIQNWNRFKDVKIIKCLPLAMLLNRTNVTHINFFILDVEGGELNVLKSIDWGSITFDVLCVETTPTERPPGYAQAVRDYLAPLGYVDATGQVGRNICK